MSSRDLASWPKSSRARIKGENGWDFIKLDDLKRKKKH